MGLEACQAAVVGAGPYGLAVTAHLKGAGVDVREFGRPMEFWERQMPEGMFLRSAWEATHIAHPEGALSLDEYEKHLGRRMSRPMPLSDYVGYGRWFQEAAVPELDRRQVVRLDRSRGGFQLTLDDGERVRAQRVVMATGLGGFGWRPPVFRGLPDELVSHSSDHASLRGFAGRRIAVVGAGQSAVESAALLDELGADVELLARARAIRWLPTARNSRFSPLVRMLLYPPTDVGPPALNWVVALPELFRLVPGPLQGRVAHRCIRPAAADWLHDRLGGVRLTTGVDVGECVASNGGARLRLSDGSERIFDHVLLATGYRVDVRRLTLLGEIAAHVETQDGMPRLRKGMETSVPGLHFVGAAAAASFGPITRFVAGTMYAARAVRQRVLEERPASVAEILRAYARQRERIDAPAT
jgi:thioredoxin reductase